MPQGFRAMILAGANSTFTAASPITPTAIASATPSGIQTLSAWDFGSPVVSSGAALFNIGSAGNLTDRALGSDPSGIGAMVIELSLTNVTGSNLAGVTFSYDLKVLTNGSDGTEAGELPGYSFFYSTTGGSTAPEWTGVTALTLTNYTEGTTMSSGSVSILFPTPLTNNGIMYFRWADDNNMANSPDQMLAIDNIVIGAVTNATITNTIVTNPPATNTAQILPQIKTVFVIAMENHNFTQPNPTSSPQQLLGNPAAPYLNSLITPGNSNSLQVSYATQYFNSAVGVHPSEPNYIWAEAGTDFGIETDADPGANCGNFFTAPHLTSQLNAAGISWKNYQEDLQFSVGPGVTSFGTTGTNINSFNGTGQYYYGAKHNPMAFFTDTQNQNVFPLTNFITDLANNTVGQYNWITPNLFNDMHSALAGGFTYRGVGYGGDQAGIAQGDNFLATVIPQIMASAAYQNNGVIILRWDESEGGDNTNFAIPEIIISPLAKGNAYASSVQMNHSSDIKTMEEIFGLPFLANAIPANEVNASGIGYNTVATVNDLSDMFQPVTSPPGNSSTNIVTNPGTNSTTNPGTNVVSNPGTNIVSNPGTNTVTTPGTNNVATAPGPVNIIGGQRLPGTGVFQLTFSGPSGQTYEVLGADNLNSPVKSWAVLTNGSFGDSNVVFPDADAPNHLSHFYIIKSP